MRFKTSLLAAAIVLSISLASMATTVAQVPLFPHILYGTLTVNSVPAPAGALVEAKVDGVVVGTITTTVSGQYGGPNALDPKLIVQGDIATGSPIGLFVNGAPAGQTATHERGAIV